MACHGTADLLLLQPPSLGVRAKTPGLAPVVESVSK
jgi:hypothetical protein